MPGVSERASRPVPSPWPLANKLATMKPVNLASSMPARFYTDPDVFDAEREHILMKGWLFLAREDQILGVGDFRAFETVGGPVVLVRGTDLVIRCFANFCRHRGSLLLEGTGTNRRIVCPYHAWSYDLDGALHTAPDMDRAECFDHSDSALVPVRMESWAGFVFVTFNDQAVPLIEYLGDLPARLASHRLDQMRCTWTVKLEPRCKLLEIGGCFPESCVTQEGFAEKAEPYYLRWELVGREDSGILEKQQHALSSVLHRPGRLSWRDDQVQALTGWVLDRLPAALVGSLET